jgi:hypothetical protein
MKGVIGQEMFACMPEIDFHTGYRYFVGSMDNYSKALLSTLKSIKAKFSLLETMIYTKEFEGLRTITQTLHKMLSNIGAVELAEDTYQLEVVLLNQDTTLIQDNLIVYLDSLAEFAEHLELLIKKVDVAGSPKHEEEQSPFLNYDFSRTKESIKQSSYLLERKII